MKALARDDAFIQAHQITESMMNISVSERKMLLAAGGGYESTTSALRLALSDPHWSESNTHSALMVSQVLPKEEAILAISTLLRRN